MNFPPVVFSPALFPRFSSSVEGLSGDVIMNAKDLINETKVERRFDSKYNYLKNTTVQERTEVDKKYATRGRLRISYKSFL